MPACENVSSFGASRITHLIASKQYDGGRKVCDALVKDAHFKSHDVLLLSYQSGKAADICELLLKIIIVISCKITACVSCSYTLSISLLVLSLFHI